MYSAVHPDKVYVFKCAWMWEKCTQTTCILKTKLHWSNPLDLLILLRLTSLLTQDQLQKMIKGMEDSNKSGLFNAAFLLCVFSQIKRADCVLCQNILYFLPLLQLLSQTKSILEDSYWCWLTLTGWDLTVRWILWQCSIYPYQFQYLLLQCVLNLWLNTLQLTVMICCLMSEHLLYKQMDQVSRCFPFKWIDNLTSHLRIFTSVSLPWILCWIVGSPPASLLLTPAYWNDAMALMLLSILTT